MFFRFPQRKMPDSDAVKDVLQEMLREDKIYIERVIPYAQAGVLQLVRNKENLSQKSMCRKEFPFGHMSLWRYTENCNRCV